MTDTKVSQAWMRDTFTDALLAEDGPQDYAGSPRRNQIIVGIALARIWADWKTGLEARPSVDTIAARLGMSANPVRAALSALTEQGWLIADMKPNRPTTYTMNIPDRSSESTPQNLRSSDSTVLIMKTSESTPQNLSKRASESEQEGFRNEGVGVQNLRTNVYQEHKSRTEVETRAHEPARTTPPPEGRTESTSSVGSSDIDPAAMDGMILDVFDRYGRAMEIGIAGGLHHTLRDKGLSNRQVLAYLEERLIEFGVSDYDTKAAVRYIIRDAAKWLADVTPPRRPEISQAQLDAEDAYDRQCAEDYAMIQSFTPAAKLLWDQAVQRTWERSMDGIDHPPEDLHALKLKLYAMSQESTR